MFGWVLLLAVTFAVPDTQGVLDAVGGAVTYIWTTSMGETWAEILLFICCVAQMFCLTASVTSASRMMFAFSRDRAVPGHQLWRKVEPQPRPVNAVVRDRRPRVGADDPDVLERRDRLPRRHVDRGDRALHRVHPPGHPPLPAGRQFEHGAWSLGKHYKWIDIVSIVWVVIISILFLGPVTPTGIPWKDGFNWDVANYAPLTVGGALLLFGGWWLISANKLVQGPGADGHRGGARADGGERAGSSVAAGAGRVAAALDPRGGAPAAPLRVSDARARRGTPARPPCAAMPLEVLGGVAVEVEVELRDDALHDAPHRLAEVGHEAHQVERRQTVSARHGLAVGAQELARARGRRARG